MSEHLRDVKNSVEKPIKSHFKIHSEKDIRYAVLQTLGGNKSKSMRLLVEDIWIWNLKTLSPCGYNIQRNRCILYPEFHARLALSGEERRATTLGREWETVMSMMTREFQRHARA